MAAKVISLLLCISAVGLCAQNSDIRIVGGRTVDLTPVNEWLVTHKGPRPMPHWKQLQLREIKGVAGGYERCAVRMEGGVTQEILLMNIPASARQFFQSIQEKQTAVARLREAQRIAKLERDRRHNEYYGTYLGSYVSTTAKSSGGTYVESEEARRQRSIQANAQYERVSEQLESALLAYDDALDRARTSTSVLAMSTGRKFANLDIWDCGSKK